MFLTSTLRNSKPEKCFSRAENVENFLSLSQDSQLFQAPFWRVCEVLFLVLGFARNIIFCAKSSRKFQHILSTRVNHHPEVTSNKIYRFRNTRMDFSAAQKAQCCVWLSTELRRKTFNFDVRTEIRDIGQTVCVFAFCVRVSTQKA